MADRYAQNPFQAMDVYIPDEYHADMQRYSQRESGANIDGSPFGRMVDMWFLAICAAARAGMKPVDTTGRKSVKIIDGAIFASDPWRIQMLMLIAIHYADGIEVVGDPRQMMNTANGLAVAGFPKVLDMLREGGGDAIWNLSESLEEMVKGKGLAA